MEENNVVEVDELESYRTAKPIVLRSPDNHEVYILEFNRDSIRRAEQSGFDIKQIDTQKLSAIEDLFFWSFAKNCPKMTRAKAMNILYDDLGGITPEILDRLAKLWVKAYMTLINSAERKNPKMIIEM